MEVILAKSAGFCYGVKRAVDMAQNLAQSMAGSKERCAMLGHIIHNDHVIAQLESQGMALCHGLDDLPSGATVLLRSHGEPKAVYDALYENWKAIYPKQLALCDDGLTRNMWIAPGL